METKGNWRATGSSISSGQTGCLRPISGELGGRQKVYVHAGLESSGMYVSGESWGAGTSYWAE